MHKQLLQKHEDLVQSHTKVGVLVQVSNPSAGEGEADRSPELPGWLVEFYSHPVYLVSHFPDEKLRYESL